MERLDDGGNPANAARVIVALHSMNQMHWPSDQIEEDEFYMDYPDYSPEGISQDRDYDLGSDSNRS